MNLEPDGAGGRRCREGDHCMESPLPKGKSEVHRLPLALRKFGPPSQGDLPLPSPAKQEEISPDRGTADPRGHGRKGKGKGKKGDRRRDNHREEAKDGKSGANIIEVAYTNPMEAIKPRERS